MISLKSKIQSWLASHAPFENSKDALWHFEKETGNKVSIIYFARVFALQPESKATKKTKVVEFIKSGNFKTCEEAHTAYSALGNEVSLIYFGRIYTEIRKANKVNDRVKILKLDGLSAKEIASVVEKNTGEKITASLKNKAQVTKQAQKLLVGKGFQLA